MDFVRSLFLWCSFFAVATQTLHSCLCYSVLFSSDNIYSPFYFFFSSFLICYVRLLSFRLFFIHFSNSIHCGMYMVWHTECWVFGPTMVGYDKKGDVSSSIFDVTITDWCHTYYHAHTHLAPFLDTHIFVCVSRVNLCSLASIAMAIIMRGWMYT